MADSLLTMTLGVGASLVKVLLQANGCVTEANFAEVAKEGLGILSWWMNRGGDADGQLAKQIAEILAKKTRDMYEVYRAQGIDEEQLGGVVTEVEIIFNKVVGNDELLFLAVNDPDSFSEVLQDDIRQRRKNIESRLEPYFDKLVEAAVDEYAKLAPWSPKFQIEALKYISDNVCKILGISIEILENSIKGLENHEITHEKLDDVMEDMDALPKRVAAEIVGIVSVQEPVIFGVRPDVAAFYIERGERARLCDLVIEGQQPRIVLVGMRGCGKSQLASDLAQWCEKQKWGLVAWINAVSREAVKNDLVELARLLPIDLSDKPNRDQIVNRCIDYFNSSNSGDRLIVFDNVKDIDDLIKLVPRGDGLRVVVTTTNDCGWKNQSWESIKIGVFSREDSIKCLLRITDSEDSEAADAVAQKLGDLPLAIAQAGATACAEDWTLKQYISRLEHYSSSIVIKPVRGDSYTEEVYKALLMAVDAALDKLGGDEREVARRQLDGLAVLAQSGVPTRWIDPLSTDAYSSDLEENVPDIADENAHNALTTLVSMSVVQQSADKTITLLHRLQAQVLRENWGKEKTAAYEEAFDAAVEILGRTKYEQLPSNDGDARRREVSDLIAQLSAIAVQDYSRSLFEREQVRGYLYRAFKYGHDLGIEYKTVELSAAVEVIEDVLGPDHPDMLTVRDNLVGAYDSVGRFAEAIDAWEELLRDCQRVLGPDHPDTLSTRNNLVGAYYSVGRFAEAIDAWEELLRDCQRVLVADDPVTLAVRSNLALAYKSVGRLAEAIDAWEELLRDCQRVLGADHPVTLRTRSYLAGAYKSVGRFGEAIELFEQVLAEHERVLGADHPVTLRTRSYLAGAYCSVGRFAEAIYELEKLLLDCRLVLGADHPVTLRTRSYLAGAYYSAGRFAEAIYELEKLVPDCRRVWGADYPDTLNVRDNLAVAYKSVGRFAEAIDAWEELLRDCQLVLGADYPDTLNVRNNLAVAYDSVGRFAEAIDAWEKLLPDCQQVLGADHPYTLTVRNNLALAYYTVCRFGEAIELFGQVLAEQERVLGPDHPKTLKIRNDLASAYYSVGRFAEVIDAWEKLLPDCRRVLGADDPVTLNVRNNLASAYYSVGRLAEAIELYEQVLAERERVLGADDPVTLNVRDNLAVAYKSVGRFAEAIDAWEKLVPDCRRVWGADHPDTLKTRNNLALVYKSVGRFAEAIDAWEKLLPDYQRVLGADDPVTLTVRNNLALAYLSVGRFGEAIELFEQVLAEQERVLGPDHPDTLKTRNNLASAYYSVGRLAEAIDAWEKLLPDCRRVLGADHPYTLTVRNNLALAYKSVGRLAEAIDAWEKLLPDCQRVLGPEHPLTKRVEKNLEAAKREMNPPDAPSPETGED